MDRCIELHNRIVAHACSHFPNRQFKIQRNWFTAHLRHPSSPDLDFDGEDGRVTVELGDELTAFLSGIDIVVPEEHQHLAFSPFLIGIPAPHKLIPDMWLASGLQEVYEDFIVLYTNTGYDPGGLVYSRTTQQVCYIESADDEPKHQLWGDLQDVLDIYWRCVESEKFVIDAEYPPGGFGEGVDGEGIGGRTGGVGQLDGHHR